jgi:hypothetical protein
MPEPVKIFAEDSKDRFFQYFWDVAVKFVILRKHFDFSRVLMGCILSFEEFLIMDIAHFLSELAGVRGYFFFNEIVDCISVVQIHVRKIAVIKGSVKHDGKVLSRTQEAGLTYLVGSSLKGMNMLHFISYSVKLFV